MAAPGSTTYAAAQRMQMTLRSIARAHGRFDGADVVAARTFERAQLATRLDRLDAREHGLGSASQAQWSGKFDS